MSRYKSQKQIRKVYSKREISSSKKKQESYMKPPSYEMKRVASAVKKKERTKSKDRKTSVERKYSSEKRDSQKKASVEKKPVVQRKPKLIPKPCKGLTEDVAPRRQSSQKEIHKRPSKVISRRNSAERLGTKAKQPPTRQRKSIRKSASNVHQKPIMRARLPPKKQAKEAAGKQNLQKTNSKKKQLPPRTKSNRAVNYMSHRSSHKDLHSRPSYSKYNYQSNMPEANKNNGTQSSINNSSRPMPPPMLQNNKPSTKYVSHNPHKGAPRMSHQEARQERKSSRGKYNPQKSGKMLHYKEYMKKMYEKQLMRRDSQKKLQTNGRKSVDEKKVYRSRVSSAEIQRDSANRYQRLYGYKPKPLWFG